MDGVALRGLYGVSGVFRIKILPLATNLPLESLSLRMLIFFMFLVCVCVCVLFIYLRDKAPN